ncbi:MAG: PDZ domain-containing protein [Planctomycetota bacterium]|jgi:type II secretory pathway component PulC
MSVKALRTVILLANLLMGAGLAFSGAVTFLESIKQEVPNRKPERLPKTPPNIRGPGVPPIVTYAPIWTMRATPADNIKAPEPVRVQEPDEDRARRALQALLSIAGIVYNRTTPEHSYAVVNLGRSESRTVSPGETVSTAQVSQILLDAVKFHFQGFDIVLNISGGTTYGRPSPRVPPRSARGARADVARAVRPAQPTPGKPFNAAATFKGSRRISNNNWQIERTEIQYVQSNQTTLIDQLSPVPAYNRDGREVGVELKKVAANSYASQRGLQQGDVVKSINGQPVQLTNMASLGKKLKGQKTLTVVVVRRGAPITLTFQMR